MSDPNTQELITLPDDGQESMEQDESVVPSSSRAATASSRRLDSRTIYFRMIAEEKGGGKISVWKSNKSINGSLQSIERDRPLKQAIGEILSYFDHHKNTYQAEEDQTKATVQTMITKYNTEKKKQTLGLGFVPVTVSAFRQAGYKEVDDWTLNLCRTASRLAARSSSGSTHIAPPPSV